VKSILVVKVAKLQCGKIARFISWKNMKVIVPVFVKDGRERVRYQLFSIWMLKVRVLRSQRG